jgi:hypothetical protein
VTPVRERIELDTRPLERLVVRKGAEELIVAAAGLVSARQNGVYHPE